MKNQFSREDLLRGLELFLKEHFSGRAFSLGLNEEGIHFSFRDHEFQIDATPLEEKCVFRIQTENGDPQENIYNLHEKLYTNVWEKTLKPYMASHIPRESANRK